jgi:hypothetical protein
MKIMDKDDLPPDPEMLRDLDFLLNLEIVENKKDWKVLNSNSKEWGLEQTSEEAAKERK